ncbi:MAG: NAD(P)H oxidoreductase [Cytophagales bacterium]|nr:MAG: NAD(P)H oxidoreductase [Cytophagales bacterium]TAH31387.1 MAG: NAD(P)H oxidoreductase [Cytophagales bacterium]
MKKIFVLMFHPRLESSHVNKFLYNQFLSQNQTIVKDMYELYPDFNIDIEKEQKDLLDSDLIIIQHPFYWYAAPPLLKQWTDLVLEYNWAYGRNGDKLKGKKILHIISSGGNFKTYSNEGSNKFTYLELLRPFELTYNLCQMKQLPPYIIPNANKLSVDELRNHAVKISAFVTSFAQDEPEVEIPTNIEYLNELK